MSKSLSKRIRRYLSVTLRQRLGTSPMQRVLAEFRKRGVRLDTLAAIELFGGTGEIETAIYAPYVKSLEIWEISPTYSSRLHRRFPSARIKITDSYHEIRTTTDRFGFIVADSPPTIHGEHCEHFDLFPDIFRIMDLPVILILNVIPHPTQRALEGMRRRDPRFFNEEHLCRRKAFYRVVEPQEITFECIEKTYRDLLTDAGYHINWFFYQPRRGLAQLRAVTYFMVMQLSKGD